MLGRVLAPPHLVPEECPGRYQEGGGN